MTNAPIIERGPTPRKWRRGSVLALNVPKYLSNKDLAKWAGQFGKVTRVQMWHDKETGRKKTYGYIEFADSDVAKVFAEKMTDTIMMGKPVTLKFCDNIDKEAAKKIYLRHEFTPRQSPAERVNEALEKRWTITVGSAKEATGVDKHVPCNGPKLFEEMGIICNWTVFTSIEQANI